MIRSEKLLEFMQTNCLSKRAFSKQCKISVATLNKVIKNENVKFVSLFKVAREMKIHIEDLLS